MQVLEGRATVEDLDGFIAQLGAIGAEHGCAVQAFDARYIVDRAHLELAVELADRARARDDAIADDPAVEILLYAAGRRQINQAFEIGLSTGDCPVVAVVHGAGDEAAAADAVRELLTPAETLGEYDADRVRDFFDVTAAELSATSAGLPALVRERVSLLSVDK